MNNISFHIIMTKKNKAILILIMNVIFFSKIITQADSSGLVGPGAVSPYSGGRRSRSRGYTTVRDPSHGRLSDVVVRGARRSISLLGPADAVEASSRFPQIMSPWLAPFKFSWWSFRQIVQFCPNIYEKARITHIEMHRSQPVRRLWTWFFIPKLHFCVRMEKGYVLPISGPVRS